MAPLNRAACRRVLSLFARDFCFLLLGGNIIALFAISLYFHTTVLLGSKRAIFHFILWEIGATPSSIYWLG